MENANLNDAKRAKNDEFYTQYSDIEKEIGAYLEYNQDVFRGQVVYCNCDDPFESNFFRYFVLNFRKLGLKQLISTSYSPSFIANTEFFTYEEENITANRFIINDVGDTDGDGEFNLKDVLLQLKMNKNNEWAPLKGNGDFRNDECIELLKQADVVVTNPPFSLFRDFIKQLVDYNKKFLIIGNMNAISCKEIFPLIKENKMWLGHTKRGTMSFMTPDKEMKSVPATWFTNLDHGRRHQPLSLMTMADNLKFSKHKDLKENGYQQYDNYNAIEVPYTDAIPSDYDGYMGVPISFMDKYCPEQFEIVGIDYDVKLGFLPHLIRVGWKGKLDKSYINNKRQFIRLLIRHRKKTS